MTHLTVYRVCRGAGPEPRRATIADMVLQLGDALAGAGFRPVTLTTEAWPIGGGEILARMRVACEPGEGGRPLRSWYQWQHPAWRWSAAPIPTVDCKGVEGLRALPCSVTEDAHDCADAQVPS